MKWLFGKKKQVLKVGDTVTSNYDGNSVTEWFKKYGPAKVILITKNDLKYTGYAFAKVKALSGEEADFYINCLKLYP